MASVDVGPWRSLPATGTDNGVHNIGEEGFAWVRRRRRDDGKSSENYVQYWRR